MNWSVFVATGFDIQLGAIQEDSRSETEGESEGESETESCLCGRALSFLTRRRTGADISTLGVDSISRQRYPPSLRRAEYTCCFSSLDTS